MSAPVIERDCAIAESAAAEESAASPDSLLVAEGVLESPLSPAISDSTPTSTGEEIPTDSPLGRAGASSPPPSVAARFAASPESWEHPPPLAAPSSAYTSAGFTAGQPKPSKMADSTTETILLPHDVQLAELLASLMCFIVLFMFLTPSAQAPDEAYGLTISAISAGHTCLSS